MWILLNFRLCLLKCSLIFTPLFYECDGYFDCGVLIWPCIWISIIVIIFFTEDRIQLGNILFGNFAPKSTILASFCTLIYTSLYIRYYPQTLGVSILYKLEDLGLCQYLNPIFATELLYNLELGLIPSLYMISPI